MGQRTVEVILKVTDRNGPAVFKHLEQGIDRTGRSLKTTERSSQGLTSAFKQLDQATDRSGRSLRQTEQSGQRLKNAFTQLDQSADRTSRGFNNAERSSNGLKNSFNQLTHASEHTSRGLQSAVLTANLLARAIAYLTQQLAAGAREYLQYNRELANLNTLLDDDRTLEKFRTGLLNLDPALGKTSELARGMYQAISSGVEAGDALQFIEKSAKAARAGLATTFEAVDAGTSVMASFGLKASEINIVYDKMFETVKRGKVEMPQLAQSIGQVTNIAAQAGVTLDEMFAAIATGSRTVRPQVFIEGFRTALANILKPSEQAMEVARRLNVEFSAEALEQKGFAAFLTEISKAAKGNKEDLARLFGDVQALNAIMAISGNQAKTFADDLKGIASASGTVEAAFQKQRQSLPSQFEAFQTTVFQGLNKALAVIEPLVSGVLSLVNRYPALFGAAAVAITGLAAAHLLWNTQLLITAGTYIPQLIANLKNLIAVMFAFNQVTSLSATGLAAFAAGWAGIVLAIGIVVVSLSNFESAAEAANKITLEQVDAQTKAYKQNQELSAAVRDAAAAQVESANRHAILKSVLDELDPTTRAYIESLKEEKDKLAAVNDELERRRTLELKPVLEAGLRVAGAGILEQLSQIELIEGRIAGIEEQIRREQDLLSKDPSWAESLRPAIQSLSSDLLAQRATLEDLRKALDENQRKQLDLAQSLGLTRDQFVLFFTSAGHSREEVDKLVRVYDLMIARQRESTNTTKESTQAVKEQTDALKRLKEIQQTMSARRERIDSATLDIIENSKDRAEALKRARERYNTDETFRKDVDAQRRTEANKRAVDQFVNPSERGAGSGIEKKRAEILSDIRALQDYFQRTFNRALPFRFGQTPLHTRLDYDHRNAADVQLDPRTPEGQAVINYLREQGIPFRASTGVERSSRTGKLISTGPHIHVGELSRSLARGEGIVSDTLLMETLRRAEEEKNVANLARLGLYVPPSSVVGQSLRNRLLTGGSFTDVLTGTQYQGAPSQPLTTETVTASSVKELPTLDERYRAGQREILDYEKQLEAALLRRRNVQGEVADDFLRDTVEIINVETNLIKLRLQNADADFVAQRRRLSALSEQKDLLSGIALVEDEIANGPLNQSLRIQLALLQDIADLRRRDEDAIKDQNRARLELADQGVFHLEQARAAVLGHLAQTRSMTQVFADGIIDSYQAINEVVLRGVEKLTGGIRILDNLIAGLVTRLTNRLFEKLLDVLLPGGAGAGGAGTAFPFGAAARGGAGPLNNFLPALNRVFAGGGNFAAAAPAGTWGGFAQMLGFPGAELTPPVSLTSQVQQQASWADFGRSLGFPGGAGVTAQAGGFSFSGVAGALAPVLPLVGAGAGISLGGSSRLGSILGGLGGGIAGLGGAALLGSSSAASALGSISTLGGLLPFALPILPIAGALLIGAYFLNRNSARRRDEKARTQVINDSLGQLKEILAAVRADRMDGQSAIAAALQIRSQYVTSAGALKDGKTRDIALRDVSRLDLIIGQIRGEANLQLSRQKIDERYVPEFDAGGFTPNHLSLIKVRPNELFLPPDVQQQLARNGGFIPGPDYGRDNTFMFAPPRSLVVPKRKAASLPSLSSFSFAPLSSGSASGSAGAAAGQPPVLSIGELVIRAEKIEVDQDAGTIVAKGLRLPAGKDAYWKNYKEGADEGRLRS